MKRQDHFSLELPSSSRFIPKVRDLVGQCAQTAGLNSQETEDIKMAACEAYANAVEHGSPDGETNRVQLNLNCADGKVNIEVRDQGKGFTVDTVPPPDLERERGRGLFLMHHLTDHIDIKPSPNGTTIQLEQVHHPAPEAQAVESQRQELSEQRMNIPDKEIQEFVQQIACTLVRVDLIMLFHSNPNIVDTVDRLSRYIGRRKDKVHMAADALTQHGILQKQVIDSTEIYLRSRDLEKWKTVLRFAENYSDRHLRYRILYQLKEEI